MMPHVYSVLINSNFYVLANVLPVSTFPSQHFPVSVLLMCPIHQGLLPSNHCLIWSTAHFAAHIPSAYMWNCYSFLRPFFFFFLGGGCLTLRNALQSRHNAIMFCLQLTALKTEHQVQVSVTSEAGQTGLHSAIILKASKTWPQTAQ